MKRNVFLTGATGHMGYQGLLQLSKRLDEFNLTLLVLPTEKDKTIIAPFEGIDGIRIVYGDLTNYGALISGE